MFYVISKGFVCEFQLHFDSFAKMPAKLAAHASTDSYLSDDAHVPVAQVGEGEPESGATVAKYYPLKGRNPVWTNKHFFLQDPPSPDVKQCLACCTYCCGGHLAGHRFAQGDVGVYVYTGSPTGMVTHLKAEHGDRWENVVAALPAKKTPLKGLGRQAQTALHKAFVRNVIVGDCLPFAAAEWEGHRAFYRELNPRYVPCGRTKATMLFHEHYEAVENHLQNEIKDRLSKAGAKVSVIIDAWQGVGKKDFMAIMVSYIDDDWNLQQKVVAAPAMVSVKDFTEIGSKLITTFRDNYNVDVAA